MKIRCPKCNRISEIPHVDHGRNAVCSCRTVFQIDDSTVVEEYSLPDQKPPDMIGRYPIKRFIGRGGSGCVYEGVHPELGIPVAIKTMPPESAGSRASRNVFYQSARIYAKAVHPNIVKVYEAGKDASDAPFLVMEYLPGGTLGDMLLEHRTFTPQEAAGIGADICRALTATNKLGIVHRDVKPDNIMVSRDGLYKLTDLGLAKFDASAVPGNGARVLDEDAPAQSLPRTGFGTLEYMSPEQYLDSESCDIRSDIYSLGATLYHLAAGRLPFETAARTELRRMHMSVEPLVPSTFAPGIPIDFDYIVLRCLQKDPADRYQTPEELLADLEAFLAGKPLPSTTCGASPAVLAMPPASASAGKNRNGFPILAAVVLAVMILVLLAMTAVVMRRGAGKSRPDRIQPPPAQTDTAPSYGTLPKTQVSTKSLEPEDATFVDLERDEREQEYFADAKAAAELALENGFGFKLAIEDLENYLSVDEYADEAETLIGRLKAASDAAVGKLLESLDLKAADFLRDGKYEEAIIVYRTDIGDLAPEAKPFLDERIAAIRKEAGYDEPEDLSGDDEPGDVSDNKPESTPSVSDDDDASVPDPGPARSGGAQDDVPIRSYNRLH